MSADYPFPMPWPSAFMETPSPPAAGAELSTPLAGQYRFHILTVSLILACDANPADRFISLSAAQSANVLYKEYSTHPATANETIQYIFNQSTHHTQQLGSIDAWLSPLGDWFIVEPSWDFQINIDNIQAGDQLSNIIVTYGRWNRPLENA